jgi:hypothetical protein
MMIKITAQVHNPLSFSSPHSFEEYTWMRPWIREETQREITIDVYGNG